VSGGTFVLHHRLRAAIGALALVGAPAAAVVATAGSASADTFTVTTTVDGAPGSLREAIESLAVNGAGDTVVLQPGATYQLDCTSGGDLEHGSTPLVIQGNGATIEQTCAGERVLDQGSADLDLEDVTLTGGNTDGPGAGVRTGGNLGVHHSTIRDNVSGPLSAGGGISMLGGESSALIEDSTISGNTARNGGGIGASAGSTVQVVNSTITGNHADGGPGTGVGGALDSNGNGEFIFIYATIVGNTANSGGANLGIGSNSDITVVNSVIADGDCSLNGNAVTSADNVTTEESCGLDDATDTLVADPMLAPLGDYGGPTLTMAPLEGSPVLDVVPTADCSAGQSNILTDQRGLPRPETAGGMCDAGAVEGVFVPDTPVVPVTPVTPAAPIAVAPRFTG
jgi:hypothetical protein